MKRYAMEKLIQWKDNEDRKPLIIKGARQVGKTWLMKEFGAACFTKCAYINFDRNYRRQKELVNVPLYAVSELWNIADELPVS